jgi:putative peptidoglycan lipid II flippase
VEASKSVSDGQTASTGTRRSIAKAAGVMSALTLASRVAGLARDIVVGGAFGASPAADAFFVAFRIPNLFRRVVAEGAASSAFVPVFTSELARGGQAAAAEAARAVGVAAMVSLALLVALGMACSDWVIAVFAPGFTSEPEKLALTVHLTRLTFPYLLLVGMAAWAMGVLNAFRRFAVPAFGPVMLNLAIIAAVLGLSGRLEQPVHALVIGVLAGGFLQFLVQWPSLRALGVSLGGFRGVVGHPAVRRVRRLLVPTIVGGAIYQINILVATIFASLLPGQSVSYLWYADRVFEFPLGVVAVAIGAAALPTLSGQAAVGRHDEMAHSVSYSLRLVWAVCLPATLGLWMLAPQIVEVLFERGRFTHGDVEMTAWALRAYVFGLLSVAAVRVLVSVFYAFEEAKVPVRTACVAFAANVITDLALMGPTDPNAGWWGAKVVATAGDWLRLADLRHAGLALGTGVAATVNAVLLYVLARRRLPGLEGRALARAFILHAGATALMGVVLWAWSLAGGLWLSPGAQAWWSVCAGVPVAIGAYVIAALWLESEEISDIVRGLRSRFFAGR